MSMQYFDSIRRDSDFMALTSGADGKLPNSDGQDRNAGKQLVQFIVN